MSLNKETGADMCHSDLFIWGLKYWEPKLSEKNLCFTFQQDLGHDLKSLVWGEDRRGEYAKHEMCFLYGYISRNPSHVSRCVVKLPHTRQQLNCASLYIVAEDRPNICGKKRKKFTQMKAGMWEIAVQHYQQKTQTLWSCHLSVFMY